MMFGDQRNAELLIHLLIAAFACRLYADAAQIAPGPFRQGPRSQETNYDLSEVVP